MKAQPRLITSRLHLVYCSHSVKLACAGAISAARLAATVLEDGHVCAAALAAVKRLSAELAAAIRAPESWVRRGSKASDRCVFCQQRKPVLGCLQCVRHADDDLVPLEWACA